MSIIEAIISNATDFGFGFLFGVVLGYFLNLAHIQKILRDERKRSDEILREEKRQNYEILKEERQRFYEKEDKEKERLLRELKDIHKNYEVIISVKDEQIKKLIFELNGKL